MAGTDEHPLVDSKNERDDEASQSTVPQQSTYDNDHERFKDAYMQTISANDPYNNPDFLDNFGIGQWSSYEHETDLTPQIPNKQMAEACADSDTALGPKARSEHQDRGATKVSNHSLASATRVRGRSLSESGLAPESPLSDMLLYTIETADYATQRNEQLDSSPDYDHPSPFSDTESETSSGRSTSNLNDLANHLLDLEISRLRSWLIARTRSEAFFRHLQRQVTRVHYDTSTPQNQSTTSSSKSTSNSAPTTSSGGSSSRSKRRQDDAGGCDERQEKRQRIFQDKPTSTITQRLACFYNKYDPVMYRSNTQTRNKFEICESHNWQDMGRLYEHLKRVHCDQPLQCPRCGRTDFESSAELQAHHTAPEPCSFVPSSVVKRIKWTSHDDRKALQIEVNQKSKIKRRLGGCTEEDRWGFAYRWLFPPTTPDDTPCPYAQDPMISVVSFVIDGYETRLRQSMNESSTMDDLADQLQIIRGQYLAQLGINTEESTQDYTLLSSASTTPGDTRPARPTALSPLDVVEPFQSDSRSQDHRQQSVLPPVNRTSGSVTLPEYCSASQISQARSSRAQSQSATSSHQITDVYRGHTEPLFPHSSAETYLLMSPTQWPHLSSMEALTQEHRALSPANQIPSATQLHCQQTQTVPAPQYQNGRREDGDFTAGLDQETTQSLGNRNDGLDDLWLYEALNTGTWAGQYDQQVFFET